jgi:hypothetical protein
MNEDRLDPERFVQLTEAQAGLLRKHLGRGTLSLDDAAVLVGVPVEDLAQHFTGRRAGQRSPDHSDEGGGERRHRHKSAAHGHAGHDADEHETGLHAPERRSHRARSQTWVWAAGGLGAVAVIGVLALLSGIPQSLLFPPRGVSAHKDAAVAADAAAPAAGSFAADPAPESPAPEGPAPEAIVAEAPTANAVDPMSAGAEPGTAADPAADPALADPNAAPPAEAPVPAAPEEVAPAVAVAEAEVPTAAAPEAPSFAAPEASAPAGPSTTLYAARAAAVRDAPTASGSNALGQLKRGDTVLGAIVAGADGKSSWLHIESGPGVGGYVSVANMADGPRPGVVQALGQPKALTQPAALHAAPDAGSATLDTLSPGISVLAAAEVEGGWIEINRRAGGVGYIRKEAFE